MFEDFLRNCPADNEMKPSKKRIKKNIAAVRSLVEKEEKAVRKRRVILKPLVIAAAITIFSMISLFTVNAAMQGAVVKFFMGGDEIEGEYYDYVDGDGFRHISFGAVLPIYEENFAVIYDVDAPQEEAVRVITDETDPEFMDKLRRLKAANDVFREARKTWLNEHGVTQEDIRDPDSEFRTNPDFDKDFDLEYPEAEDFGLVFKDSELCTYRLGFVAKDDFELYDGTLGGKFMYTGAAEGKPAGSGVGNEPNECTYDWENETKTWRETFYYYVGTE